MGRDTEGRDKEGRDKEDSCVPLATFGKARGAMLAGGAMLAMLVGEACGLGLCAPVVWLFV